MPGVYDNHDTHLWLIRKMEICDGSVLGSHCLPVRRIRCCISIAGETEHDLKGGTNCEEKSDESF